MPADAAQESLATRLRESRKRRPAAEVSAPEPGAGDVAGPARRVIRRGGVGRAGPSVAGDLPETLEQLLPVSLTSRLDRLDLHSRRTFAGRLPGERRSKSRGQSVEFDDFRPYTEGDDLRHLDWNVLARFDRMVIKLFREDRDLTVHLILDATGSMVMGSPPKLALAARVVAALGHIALVRRDRLLLTSLTSEAGELRSAGFGPMRGRSAVRPMLEHVLGVVAAAASPRPPLRAAGRGPERLARALKRSMARQRGRGVVVLVSDLLFEGDVGAALRVLSAAGGFEAHVLRVLSPDDLDPRLAGIAGDVRLTDVETGGAAEVTAVPEAVAAYRRRADSHVERVATACRASGVHHRLVMSDEDADELVVRGLRASGMLR